MAFELPALPYAEDALEPHIDARTMGIHHDKHHAGYTNNLNNALSGHAALEAMSVDSHGRAQQRRRLCQSLVVLADNGPQCRRCPHGRPGRGD